MIIIIYIKKITKYIYLQSIFLEKKNKNINNVITYITYTFKGKKQEYFNNVITYITQEFYSIKHEYYIYSDYYRRVFYL